MKRVYIIAGAIAVVAWIGLGLVIARGPQPEIVVPAEVLWTVGPLNITNTLLTAWIVMAFLIIISLIATRSMKLMPSGIQNFVEAVVSFLLGQVEDIAGEKNGRRFFMVIATIFLFIITANWFGLFPFFNAIGKTEDVGHEIFHELSSEHPEKLMLTAEGVYEENHKFAAAKSDGSGSLFYIKPNGKAVDFEVLAGETPGQAFDRYIVFLAETLAGFEPHHDIEHGPADPEDVKAAFALLGTADHKGSAANAPRLIAIEGDHGAQDSGAHGLESPTLHATFSGVDFEESQKLLLIIPLFRGVYSDVNNTLALGIVAFLCIEFWGFQALGFGYLGKFFNFKSPIGAFVGILELLSEFIRVISFTFRLFGNIFAGEVLVLMLTFLMPFLIVDIIYGLELFVGFIQAAVFALLTLVFATMAVEHHGEGDHDDGHDSHEGGHHETGAVQAH